MAVLRKSNDCMGDCQNVEEKGKNPVVVCCGNVVVVRSSNLVRGFADEGWANLIIPGRTAECEYEQYRKQ